MSIQEANLSPVSRVQIARYAGAVGDFNPIHVDESFAKNLGLPSVIAHGPLTAALALGELVRQVGASSIKKLDVKFKAPLFPEEAIALVPIEGGVELRDPRGQAIASIQVELRG